MARLLMGCSHAVDAMAEPEVLDLTFESASDDEDRAPPVRAPGYKNHNAPGLREAPEAPRRRSVPTKRYSEEFAPPRRREEQDDDEEPPPKPKRRSRWLVARQGAAVASA